MALACLGNLLFVIVTWWVARRFLDASCASYVSLLVAVNPLLVHESQLLGTDVLWSALVLAALMFVSRGRDRGQFIDFALAGICLGIGWTIRYAALVVIAVVLLVTFVDAHRTPLLRRCARAFVFVAAIAIAAAPQWWIALKDTGNPFANSQAKNVWFGIFGHRDWISNWRLVPNDANFFEIVKLYPELLFRNVTSNLIELVEHVLLIPLGFTPNATVFLSSRFLTALALVASVIATTVSSVHWRSRFRAACVSILSRPDSRLMAVFASAYGLSICFAFWMPRFFLPLLPLVVVTLGGLLRLPAEPTSSGSAWRRAGVITLPLFLAALSISSHLHFLRVSQQPIDEVRAALLTAGVRYDSDRVMTSATQHYATLIPFPFVTLPLDVKTTSDLRSVMREQHATYLLYEEKVGPRGTYWPALDSLFARPEDCPFLEPLWFHNQFPRVMLLRARNLQDSP